MAFFAQKPEKFVAEDRPPEDLLDFFITVNEKLLLSKSSDPQVRSQRLHYYAAQLNRSGQAEEALIPAEEAVELRRLLVNNQPGLLPDLAESLYVLSISYSNSEEGKEKNNVLALETIKEAVVHAENLLDEYDPYSYIRLGRFLNSYAIDLFRQKNVGKEEFISAFSVIETSEEKHRHVLTYFSSTRGFNMNNAKGELARTLFTKGQIQRLLNEDAKAHASFLESIQFKRELVAQGPGATKILWGWRWKMNLAADSPLAFRNLKNQSKKP
ncbi:MAG: hypothetical protein IPK76_21955 [Lewinellaceae bacterium]|nr:hypothetical protein [Lewinellaceae bacterium]